MHSESCGATLARVARRMAGSGEYRGLAGYLEKVADYAENILTPLLRLALGGGEGLEGALAAARRLAERYPYQHRLVIKLMQRLALAFGLEDWEKLVEVVERAVEASKLAERVDQLARRMVLVLRRDARNSVIGDAAGLVCIVEYGSGKRLHELWEDEVSVDCKRVRSRELLDILARVIGEMGIPEGMFSTYTVSSLVEASLYFDNPDQFEGFTREDILKLAEATLEAVVESDRKNDIASRTVTLSDGRKLHVIVHSWVGVKSKFLDAILILSNLEIKATYMETFIKTKRFKNDEKTVKYITSMREEDLAKLDEETLVTILELLVQRALVESVERA